MCQSLKAPAVPAISAQPSKQPELCLPKHRLNPRALEFVASSSSSEASSPNHRPSSEVDAQQLGDPESLAPEDPEWSDGQESDQGCMQGNPGAAEHTQQASDDQPRWTEGWESPQVSVPAACPWLLAGRLKLRSNTAMSCSMMRQRNHAHRPPPSLRAQSAAAYSIAPDAARSPPLCTLQGVLPSSQYALAMHLHAHGMPGPQGSDNAKPDADADTDAVRPRRDAGAASPPIPPHAMSASAYPWGAHTHPYNAVWYHDGVALDRSGSPPTYPGGGSPPVAPGFISVPVHPHHHGRMAEPGSPTGPIAVMYHPHPHHPAAAGASPPGYHLPHLGASPPPFGGSPPLGVSGSPPGGHYLYVPGDYNNHHGYGHHPMHQQQHHQHQHLLHHQQQQLHHNQHQHGGPDFLSHHMGGLALGPGSSGSAGSGAGGGGAGSARASARIARSHRAGGAYNPSQFEFSLAEAEAGGEGARTTVMIRNVPNKYTQAAMLEVLHKAGFAGAFDFFYLPIDFRNRCGLGYAFVNMTSPAAAARLYRAFHTHRWEEYNSKKVCEVTYARVQGRDALVEHFRAAKFPSDDAEYQPLVYVHSEGAQGQAPSAVDPLPIHAFLAAAARGGEGEGEAPL